MNNIQAIPSSKFIWKVFFVIGAGLAFYTVFDIFEFSNKLNFSLIQSNWIGIVVLFILAGVTLSALLILTFTKYSENIFIIFERPYPYWLGVLFLGIAIFFFWGIYLNPQFSMILGGQNGIVLFAIYIIIFLLGMGLKQIFSGKSTGFIFTTAIIILLIVFKLADSVSQITSEPFINGWSESSRYYGASLLFDQRLYNADIPLSVLHPSLHFLLAFPFLFGDLPIAYHRGWLLLLNFLLPCFTAFALSKRLSLKSADFWLFNGGAFLFLLQGPIYAHLLLIPAIIFYFYKNNKLTVIWSILIITSVWAGMSRINWFPVPAMLISALYVLETPLGRGENPWRYFSKPFLWFVTGMSIALISQSAYIYFSGNADKAGNFFSSLSSDLLWYRLLPNATYPPGVILGILVVSAPLLLILFLAFRSPMVHPLRILFSVTEIFILFIGGLIVSVKIGGGGDLHNMDAYIILLLLICSYIYFEKVYSDSTAINLLKNLKLGIASLAIFSFFFFGIQTTPFIKTNDLKAENKAVKEIQAQVDMVVKNKGEVLFITQRHLLAFNIIKNASLVPDYERDYLMEVLMSHDEANYEKFRGDIESKRFDLIITSDQKNIIIGLQVVKKHPFGEEGNLWVRKVTQLLLCHYEIQRTFEQVNVELLIPFDNPECQ